MMTSFIETTENRKDQSRGEREPWSRVWNFDQIPQSYKPNSAVKVH